jgi:hypothetical protein
MERQPHLADMEPAPAAPLPLSIPTDYWDNQGRLCLAYARSPWTPQRYLVIRCDKARDPSSTDLECVHDDHGNLVPLRQRRVSDDWASAMAWSRAKVAA